MANQYGVPLQSHMRGKLVGQPETGKATPYGAALPVNTPKVKPADTTPDQRTVERFHLHADTDIRDVSIHHTLGISPTQASPGAHTHDGGSSKKILDGFTLSGSRASLAAVLPDILNCLVRLGAKNNTTA